MSLTLASTMGAVARTVAGVTAGQALTAISAVAGGVAGLLRRGAGPPTPVTPVTQFMLVPGEGRRPGTAARADLRVVPELAATPS